MRACARTAAEWDAYPKHQATAGAGPVEIVHIGDAPPQPFPKGPRPLLAVRMLDLTHILAGPTCSRALAETGVEVLLVIARQLPSVKAFVLDTGQGKSSACLDLDEPGDSLLYRGWWPARMFSAEASGRVGWRAAVWRRRRWPGCVQALCAYRSTAMVMQAHG